MRTNIRGPGRFQLGSIQPKFLGEPENIGKFGSRRKKNVAKKTIERIIVEKRPSLLM
ncbi:MAG: hypothetical protein ACK4GQ_03120 [Candidatus Hadarchaeales archaeon]